MMPCLTQDQRTHRGAVLIQPCRFLFWPLASVEARLQPSLLLDQCRLTAPQAKPSLLFGEVVLFHTRHRESCLAHRLTARVLPSSTSPHGLDQDSVAPRNPRMSSTIYRNVGCRLEVF